MDTIGLIATLVVLGLLAVVGGVWLYLRSRKPKPAFKTKHGLHVYENLWKQGDTEKPLPTQREVEAWWGDVSPKLRKVLQRRLGVRAPDMSLKGLKLFWRPGMKMSRDSQGGFMGDPESQSFYFEDPKAIPTRNHHWYAGWQLEDEVHVAWADSLERTELDHEIGHYVSERNGLREDPTHQTYPELWKVV